MNDLSLVADPGLTVGAGELNKIHYRGERKGCKLKTVNCLEDCTAPLCTNTVEIRVLHLLRDRTCYADMDANRDAH